MIILQIFRTIFCLFKLFSLLKSKMMLYKKQAQPESASTPSTLDKRRNKYRTEIRQSFLKQHFKQVRAKMMQDLKSQQLIEILRSLDSKFNEEEFNILINILESQCDLLEFNMKMAEQKMQQIIVNVILNNSENIQTKKNKKLISVLSFITYYSTNSINRLISRFDFIEHLRKTIQQIEIKVQENISYFKEIIILLMNITSALQRDFNMYMAESDICYSIIRKIGNTKQYLTEQDSTYNELVYQTREYILKMLKNVINNLNDEAKYSSKLVAQILQDEYFTGKHMGRIFLLLSEGLNEEKFWQLLQQKEVNYNFSSILVDSMGEIQERCFLKQFLNDKQNELTEKEIQLFYSMLRFLNSLYYQGQQHEISWNRMIESSLNGFMLADFLFQALKKQNIQQIETALITYICLSNTIDVTGDQLIIVRPALDQLQFLKTIVDLKIIGNSKYGKLCLIILKNLLLKDEKYVQILVRMRVIDILADIISATGKVTELLIESIALCIQLIMAERKAGKDRKVYELMMEKGFMKLMEDCQATLNRDLSVKVDMLVDMFLEEKEAK